MRTQVKLLKEHGRYYVRVDWAVGGPGQGHSEHVVLHQVHPRDALGYSIDSEPAHDVVAWERTLNPPKGIERQALKALQKARKLNGEEPKGTGGGDGQNQSGG